MERIIQEKISADHLLYVSLKYTKTCDVILNLIARWKSMIDLAMDRLLEKAKSRRMISSIPSSPKPKLEALKKLFARNPDVKVTLELYEFFKRVEDSQKIRENEFRKNVTLKILDKGNYVNIDLEKLKEYRKIIEVFIAFVKQFLG
jgi:hypothetical protein